MSNDNTQQAIEVISRADPEPIREHWVDVDGVRYPPKQAYQLLTGLPRSAYTSHRALSELRKRGFRTSTYQPHQRPPDETGGDVTENLDPESAALAGSFATLAKFLTDRPLTEHLASAESAFSGATADRCEEVAAEFAFSEDLLDAALAVRTRVGRLNDVIHATVIARVLSLILLPEETITNRPSLGAGNDPSRPYDLETSHRIAEFKLAQWKGADTMRQRGVFTDLVHLALDDTDRHAQLFIVGLRPGKFLATSKSNAERTLGRSSPHMRQRFQDRFGRGGDLTVAEFTAGPARDVEIVDLTGYFPSLTLPDTLL